MKLPALITTIGFVLILSVTLVQTFWHVVPETELKGVTVETPPIQASVRNWQNGKLQSQLEAWLEQHVGFRPAGVRTENQINFSAFRELTRNGGTDIVLGQEDWLYERQYIDRYLGKDLAPLEFCEQFTRDLKDLQDELAKRQIGLVMVISPSKAATYPEHLPLGMAPDCPPPTNHQQLVPLLLRARVNLLDAATLIRGEKAAHPEYLLFPRGGTHWDYYGASLVLKNLMPQIAAVTGKPSLQYKLGPIVVDRRMEPTENDLGEVLNLWTPEVFISPLPHAKLQRTAPPGSRLNMLWIGSSFSLTLLDLLSRTGGYQACEFLYYDRTAYLYPPPLKQRGVERMKFSVKTQLLSRQVVVLEVNESSLVPAGDDIYAPRFVRDALAYLRSDEAAAKSPESPAESAK